MIRRGDPNLLHRDGLGLLRVVCRACVFFRELEAVYGMGKRAVDAPRRAARHGAMDETTRYRGDAEICCRRTLLRQRPVHDQSVAPAEMFGL